MAGVFSGEFDAVLIAPEPGAVPARARLGRSKPVKTRRSRQNLLQRAGGGIQGTEWARRARTAATALTGAVRTGLLRPICRGLLTPKPSWGSAGSVDGRPAYFLVAFVWCPELRWWCRAALTGQCRVRAHSGSSSLPHRDATPPTQTPGIDR